MAPTNNPASSDLKAILDAAGTMIIATDLTGTVRIFNQAAELLLGWNAGEVVGRHTPALWHDAAEVATRAAELTQELGRTIAPGFEVLIAKANAGQTEQREWTYIRKDGTRFPVQLVVSAIRDAAGVVTGYLGTAQDLMARVQAEQERDRFFNLSIDLLGIASTDGYFKRINPAFRDTLGWTEEEILGRPFLDFVHPADQAATLQEVNKLASGEPTLHFENRYRCKDGSWRWLAWTTTPQPDGTLYATGRDVTKLKQAEEALRESRQDLAVTLNSIGDAVMTTDAARRITRMNPVAEQLTGWSESEAQGHSIDEVFRIINEETRRPATIPVDDVLATGTVHGLANHTALIARDGTERSIADSAAPIRSETGQITGVVLVFRDVGEERKFERELQRLNADLEHRVQERTNALREKERFNRATLDSLSSHVAVLDDDGNIVATNQAWKNFAQASSTAWQAVSESTNYLTVCDEAAACGDTDAAAAAQAIRQVIAGKQQLWFHEYPCHAPDAQRWFYCRVTRFPANGTVHVVVVHENITAMKSAMEQLSISRARYESLSNVSPVGIILFDPSGQAVEVNKRWCEMTGITPEQALGDGWHAAIHPEDRARVVVQWTATVHGELLFFSEHRVQPHNGHTTWVVCQGEKIVNPQGEVTGFVRTITDFSRRKQTEQALELLSSTLATLSGTAFYEAVCLRLAELLDLECVAICNFDSLQQDRFLTLAVTLDGQIHPNLSYAAAGTPCAEITERNRCIIPRNVQQQYPEDIFLAEHQFESYAGVRITDSAGRQVGHIATMSRKPMHAPADVEAILTLFAVSVAAEMERQHLARRYSDLFEFSSDAIILTDSDGIIVQANRQVEVVFGWKREDLVGQPVEVLMPPETGAGHIGLRRQYVQTSMPRTMGGGRPNLRGMRKDGTFFHVDISLSPMETVDGVMVAAAIRDRTEREAVERELHDAKVFSDTLIESVSGLFFVLDVNGSFTRWNKSLRELLGLTSSEMAKTTAISTIHPDDQMLIAEKMAEVFSSGYAKAEARLLAKGRTSPWYLLSGRRLDISGTSYLVGLGADITDRKRAEDEIRQFNQRLEKRVDERTEELSNAMSELQGANQAKSEFLATMSHELRTPLNGILGMNELLLQTELTERQKQFAEACSSSGKLLVQLINDILDLSKIEAGKLELDPRECDIEALIYDVAGILFHTAQQKGLTLSCHLAPEVCVVGVCDDNRVRQVLVNLVSNALKFTASGGVTITGTRLTQPDGRSRVRINVVDTGVGIPQERRNRLFRAFSQVDSSTTRQYGGTGLGLSICLQLIELMGGEMGVESQVGVGSTFWFEIPLQITNENSRTLRMGQSLAGLRVLAIDGLDRERQQISDCLTSWGCSFQHVATIQEALDAVADAQAAEAPFALILADCRLVKGDEYVALQKLTATSGLPVIGLGNPPDDLSMDHLHTIGVRHVLHDPIRPSMLLNVMRSVLLVTSGLKASEQESESVATPRGSTDSLAGHILVAEDNRINQLCIIELLKLLRCTCDLVANGEEALAAVGKQRYDLVLMDCQMPEMDGFSATREIRKFEAASKSSEKLPIVALTANALKGDRERCIDAGMDDYLSKPIDSTQLRAVLTKYLSRPTQGTSASSEAE